MKTELLWLLLVAPYLCGLTNAEESRDGFVSLFDGKSLDGWREAPTGKESAWSVKDGVIRGEGKENRQVYLIYSGDEELADFELKFSYRLLTKGNTGVETRARVDKTGKRDFEGYHADLGHVGIGDGVLGAWDFHFGKGTRKEFPCPRGTSLVIDEKGKGHHRKIENAVQVKEIKRATGMPVGSWRREITFSFSSMENSHRSSPTSWRGSNFAKDSSGCNSTTKGWWWSTRISS